MTQREIVVEGHVCSVDLPRLSVPLVLLISARSNHFEAWCANEQRNIMQQRKRLSFSLDIRYNLRCKNAYKTV